MCIYIYIYIIHILILLYSIAPIVKYWTIVGNLSSIQPPACSFWRLAGSNPQDEERIRHAIAGSEDNVLLAVNVLKSAAWIKACVFDSFDNYV